jgi:hypothetical protein
MHTFIYPSKNSYITNENDYDAVNFSLDSTLEIKSINQLIPVYSLYITQSISGSTSCNTSLYGFVGGFFGKLIGTIELANIYVSGSGKFVTDHFSGSYTSGSATSGSAISGSISGSSMSGFVVGFFSGSADYISGSISNFTGSILSGSSYAGTSSIYSPSLLYDVQSTISRTLMQFDLSSISQSIANGSITNTSSLKYYLTMKNAKVSEVPLSYTILAYPVIRDWQDGDGRYQLGGSLNGVSWIYSDGNGGTQWTTRGGDYTASISSSQIFNHSNSDIRMDITSIGNLWARGTLSNKGLILLTSLESSSLLTTNTLRFFGTETNTIYSPYLDVYWDNSSYTTGSLSSSLFPYSVVLQNVKGEYKSGNIPRINVFSRPQAPLKNFAKGLQSNYFVTSSYLPTSSYYMIKDNESEEVFIDFDAGTKISCDGTSNYFIFDTTGLPQERYFKILIKTVESSGEVNISDNNTIFKIVR